MIMAPEWSKGTVFAVLIGIVAFSLFMGSRGRHAQPRRYGWWAGLVVLLVILAFTFGFTTLRMRSVVEERHASRNTFTRELEAAREEIDRGMQEVKQGIKEKVQDAQRALRVATGRQEENPSPRVEVWSGNPPRVPPPPADPRGPVVFEVTVSNLERSQNKDIVQQELFRKATERVIEWLKENLPVKDVNLHTVVTHELLSEKGAFDEIAINGEPVQGTTDTLFGGSMRVKLNPELQEFLKNAGFQKLDRQLKNVKLMQQGVVSVMLLLATVAAVVIGLICHAHRSWKSQPALQ